MSRKVKAAILILFLSNIVFAADITNKDRQSEPLISAKEIINDLKNLEEEQGIKASTLI
ncbi:exported hypothetical protein [Gammaproteobacteria bacterium]